MSEYRLDNEHSFSGEWWIKGQKQNTKRVGELRYQPEDGLVLKLGELFDQPASLKEWFEMHEKIGDAFVVCGVVEGGKKITLSDCFYYSNGIRANAAFVGIHCNPKRPPKVKSVILRINNLGEWIGGFEPRLRQEKDKLIIESKPVAPVDVLTGRLDSEKASVFVSHTTHFKQQNVKYEVEYRSSLRLEFDSARSFQSAQAISFRIEKLMNLLIGKPTACLSQCYEHDRNSTTYFVAPTWAKLQSPKLRRHDVRCSIDQAGFDFIRVLDKWLESGKQFDTTTTLLHAVLMKTASFLETEITEIMQAIESYCSATEPFEYLTSEEFDKVVKSILETVKGFSEEFRVRVKGTIEHLNRPSLRGHLSRLFKRLDTVLAKNVTGSTKYAPFINQTVDARNMIAHPQSGNLWTEFSTDKILELISRLKLLLVINLLRDCEVPLDILQNRYNDYRVWQWA